MLKTSYGPSSSSWARLRSVVCVCDRQDELKNRYTTSTHQTSFPGPHETDLAGGGRRGRLREARVRALCGRPTGRLVGCKVRAASFLTLRELMLAALLVSLAALRAPVAPELDGYPLTRYLGLLPSFRRDAVGCFAAHASYCRDQGLDAVALDMGLLGRFTMVIGSEQVSSIFDDRENIYFKSAIDRRGVGLLTGIGVLLADGEEHTLRRRLVLPSFEPRRLDRYVDIMSTVATDLSDELLQAAESTPSRSSNMPVAGTMSAAALRIDWLVPLLLRSERQRRQLRERS